MSNSISSEVLTVQSTIHESVLRSAERHGDREALIGEGGAGERITFAELSRRILAVAGGLRSLGIQQGKRVALLGENRPEWALSYLAIQAAGATVVPLDALLKPHEHLTLIQEGAPEAIILSQKFYTALADQLKSRFPKLHIICMDNVGESITSLFEFYDHDPLSLEDISPNHPAALIFTSGTTGKPKAVILTHKNITANISGVFKALQFQPDDRFLSVLPLSHVYECTAGFLLPLMAGCTIVYARSLAAQSVVEDMRKNKVTILVGVPLLYEKMSRGMRRKISDAPAHRRLLFNTLFAFSRAGLRKGKRRGEKLFASLRKKAGMDHIRLLVSGGAPLDPAIAEFFEALGFTFLQGYGMTEASPVITVNLPGRNIIGSVGPPLPGMEVRIENPTAEGIGEILARGDSVTPGYMDDAEKTTEILRNGWLHTGDLGRFDEHGHLYISGRAKNLIVSAGGKNIYPEEIETMLLESDYILEALVVGRRLDNKQGETVHAMLYPDVEMLKPQFPAVDPEKPETLLTPEIERLISDAVKETNSRLAEFKRIASFEVRGTEFEKTASRKIKRTLYK